MEELISRQAALDTVAAVHGRYRSRNVDDYHDIMVEEFQELPATEVPEWAKEIERMYNKALGMPYVRKPLAWALYQTWKKYDTEDNQG